MKTLLTGAAGFLGSHALRHLLVNTDDEIICPVSFKHKGLPARLRVAMAMGEAKGLDVLRAKRVKVIYCDLREIDAMTERDIGQVDRIINYAAESHVDRSISDPVPFISNNVDVVVSMLEFARRQESLTSFVQISTDEVYGPASREEYPSGHPEWAPIIPSNPYSASKAAQEAIAISYWRTYDLPITILNCMNLIGETQDTEKFFPMVMKKILASEPVPIHAMSMAAIGWMRPVPYTIGSRFYLHARNLADAALYVSGHPRLRYSEGLDKPNRYNVVGEREMDNLEMAKAIFAAMRGSGELAHEFVDFHSTRPGHDLRYALDGSKLERLGWKRPIDISESIDRTVRWTLNHKEWLA